jgi:hypothetical protein
MRKLAHTRPAAAIRELPKIVAVPAHESARITPFSVKNEVPSPLWLGYSSGMEHAFLIPVRPDGDESVKAVCGRVMDSQRLAPSKRQRCKTCTIRMAEDTRKRGKELSEPTTDNVATGLTQGDPKDAERRRTAELKPLFGEASKINPVIVDLTRDGRDDEALALARRLDVSAKSIGGMVPKAERSPIGQRDHGMSDGVALVQGPNMEATDGQVTDWERPTGDLPNCLVGAPIAEPNPDAPRRTWRNPVTGAIEPASPRLDGSLRERVDRTIVPDAADRDGFVQSSARRTPASKRRHRRKVNAERKAQARIAERKRGK